jgi:membrane fusion protein (multidrug efflux system)
MDKKKIFIAMGIVVLLGGGYLVYQTLTYVTTDNAQVEAHAVMLAPKVNGFVIKVNVEEGQHVKANETLIEIDNRDYVNKITQYKSQQASIGAREADAEHNFKRLSQLYKGEAISQQQYDQAATLYRELKAQNDGLAAQVAQAEIDLEHTKIMAPSDGFIAKKSVNIGQLASVGIPLLGFIDSGERWVIANFKETELEGVEPGKTVDVTIDAISGQTFNGTVENIMAATGATFTLLPPDNATGNFTKVVQRVPVRIKLNNLSAAQIEKLRAGLSAYVKVHRH